MRIDACLSSNRMDWETPQDLFDKLNEEFHFDLDPASTDDNAKCANHFTEADDGLSQSWEGHTVFCNPPYGREIGKWVAKAAKESKKPNTKVVLLIPARTDTAYFHDHIYGKAEIRFLRGRLKFALGGGSTRKRTISLNDLHFLNQGVFNMKIKQLSRRWCDVCAT